MTGPSSEPASGDPSLHERIDRGVDVREQTPWAAHAEFAPAPGRDALSILQRQAESRVPDLVPIRYGRMLVSPFTYFRGAAAVMAADLATTPTSGLSAQLCGDAHLLNFGMYASPERQLVFDVNDFDETYPGPWEWDVKRLAASFVIASRGNGHSHTAQQDVALGTLRQYQTTMRNLAAQGHLAAWYAQLALDESAQRILHPLSKRDRKAVGAEMTKAQRRTSLQATNKLTTIESGNRRFITEPQLIEPLRNLMPDADGRVLETQLHDLFESYRASVSHSVAVLLGRFELVDIARKVVGVGSVGTRCFIVLLRGRNDDDWLILQVKEAERSVLADHQANAPATYPTQGERVVDGQRLMQATSDIFLGWVSADDVEGGGRRDYYLRQLRDWKGSAQVESMPAKELRAYGELCGWTLARAHARSGDRVAIATYLGDGDGFAQAVAEFAAKYAHQNELDHAALSDAVAQGGVVATTGL